MCGAGYQNDVVADAVTLTAPRLRLETHPRMKDGDGEEREKDRESG